ncbi:hypothetical protein CEXT_613781 [Caerostris extrusa]|uniref:Uncharacterized protein n=1 Tax=Caerostris extrusa TaxID=172846 RepID=A0AAV4NC05_CAEEX|nr:hypothetical protein CEXT_613781 [Caerostris extrusa]
MFLICFLQQTAVITQICIFRVVSVLRPKVDRIRRATRKATSDHELSIPHLIQKLQTQNLLSVCVQLRGALLPVQRRPPVPPAAAARLAGGVGQRQQYLQRAPDAAQAHAHLLQAPPAEGHEVLLLHQPQPRRQRSQAALAEDGALQEGAAGLVPERQGQVAPQPAAPTEPRSRNRTRLQAAVRAGLAAPVLRPLQAGLLPHGRPAHAHHAGGAEHPNLHQPPVNSVQTARILLCGG